MINKKYQIPTYLKWFMSSVVSMLLKLILDVYFFIWKFGSHLAATYLKSAGNSQ